MRSANSHSTKWPKDLHAGTFPQYPFPSLLSLIPDPLTRLNGRDSIRKYCNYIEDEDEIMAMLNAVVPAAASCQGKSGERGKRNGVWGCGLCGVNSGLVEP